MIPADRAFQHLDGRVVRAGQFLNHHGHVVHITRRLQLIFKGQNGLCRDSGVKRFLIDLREGRSPQLRAALAEPRLERAIGVIYRPQTELASHYFDASLPRQFDAYLWFEQTRAVTPLPTTPRPGMPETYPFGL